MPQAKFILLLAMLFISSLGACQTGASEREEKIARSSVEYPFQKTEAEWRKQLSAEAYNVLRQKGTERAFSGKYNNHKKKGIYHCAGCGQALFSSKTKFDSGTGWPSFYQPLSPEAVVEEADNSHGMLRAEVLCSNCGGHLGHVFNDGPKPTGMRYCLNSVALEFEVSH